MIPGGDHSSRTLLLRQVSSYSEVVPGGTSTSNTPTHTPRPSSSSYTAIFQDDEVNEAMSNVTIDDLSRPLLPSLEYEESSHSSSSSTNTNSSSQQRQWSLMNWKLWVGFVLLVFTGVGNVIFAKLQALPMYNYPTFLNMYANLLYILMSFAYIIPVTTFGWFNHSIQYSHLTNLSKKPFFIMGCLDAIGAAMQVLATVYLPGTLLVLIPQAAIPLSMLAGALILREKYTFHQYLGAGVVFCGILVVLFPIFTHQTVADHHCQAKDMKNDCMLCEAETTEDDCLSHVKRHGDNEAQHFSIWVSSLASDNGTNSDDNDTDHYCAWVSRELSIRHEDWLVFAWSIVMLISCIPIVMSTVYKQVALQAPLDPILINGWVALFQFICGMFLVVPSGLVSSPRVHPLELRTNWLNAMECLFTQTNSIHVGCHPDDCFRAALWVHVSLINSAIYSLAMIFVLKYGGCDLMYLGLTLVVPLGHLAFSFHSSFSTTSVYDVLGLVVLVVGLFMFRFGYGRAGDHQHAYHGVAEVEQHEGADNHDILNNSSDQISVVTTDATYGKEGFLEFLREPFRMVGDI